MSISETRRPLAEATALATALADLLRASCERIAVAGSIRRQRPDVGDLELCAIPLLAEQRDLFGAAVGTVNLLEARVAVLLEDGTLAPRLDVNGSPRLGPKHKALVYRNVGVDLFITSPECWGMIYLIRTGPADFSHRLVTPRQQGGLLPNHLRVRDGRLVGTDGQPLDTLQEVDVFRVIGLEWIAPEDRR